MPRCLHARARGAPASADAQTPATARRPATRLRAAPRRRETLRLHNIVSGVLRCAGRDLSMGGATVPAGSLLYLPLTHMALTDARFADDEPATFRPERMLTPEGRQPGSQMPFGHGSRWAHGRVLRGGEQALMDASGMRLPRSGCINAAADAAVAPLCMHPAAPRPRHRAPRFCAGAGVAMAEMRVFLALLARGYEFAANIDTEWVQQLGQVPANGMPATFSRRGAAA